MAVSSLPDHPDVWTDGSLVLDRLTGVSSAGLGFLLTSLNFFGGIVGGVMLMVFALILTLSVVEVLFISWASSICSEGLRCGESF